MTALGMNGSAITWDATDRVFRDIQSGHTLSVVEVMEAFVERDALRKTLSELHALQVNGFDPLAAARDYPRLRDALESVCEYDYVTQPSAFLHELDKARAALGDQS